ncbi:cell adhesion molecule 2-like [Palaemon carinicauda]|uniref:cell adhesion molecule 2-like n=1 Tax=Palaemon carinicauda TaxID=392227 RepID=UPI0035B60B47
MEAPIHHARLNTLQDSHFNPREDRKDDHWSDIKVLGSRATLEVTTSPALLRLTSVRDGDQGLYKCRVDFKLQPTKTTRVNLTVVTPPESVSVIIHKKDGPSTRVTNIVGPYTEGDILKLTCIAHGGKPRPSVVWFEDTHLLDSHMESEDEEKTTTQTPPGNTTTLSTRPTKLPPSSGSLSNDPHEEQSPKNTLILGPLTRSDLKLLLTCEAANNNITLPISVVVMVEMNLPPLLVVIRSPKLPLIAEKEYKVVCEVIGSRPPPTITWWSDDQRVLQAIKTYSGSKASEACWCLIDSGYDFFIYVVRLGEHTAKMKETVSRLLESIWGVGYEIAVVSI